MTFYMILQAEERYLSLRSLLFYVLIMDVAVLISAYWYRAANLVTVGILSALTVRVIYELLLARMELERHDIRTIGIVTSIVHIFSEST